ncbi:MAG TPA: SDR family oxidoreductase [Gaiellaceae bacterium]|nr:SDR family oxidoreductase [Gaiellaceae bacterium]
MARSVAVITGASSGIGEALARRLADRGWRCVLLARRRERLDALARELDGEPQACDVSIREEVERAAAAVAERHGRIRLLVNNAGIPGRSQTLPRDPEQMQRVLATNFLGTVWATWAFLPLLEAGRPSRIVNVVSVSGAVSFPPMGPYAPSKHAQLAFSRAAAAELAPRDIGVLTVNPGFVHTEGFPNRERLRSPLLRRLVVDPDRVADHVLRALDRGTLETFVPPWYRGAALVQALAPGTTARLLGRLAARRM